MKQRITILFFIFLTKTLFAQKYSNSFLDLPVGAKSAALGQAMTALPNGVFSVFSNPATIIQKNNSYDAIFGLQHTESFGGIANLDHFGVLIPFDKQRKNIGFSVLRYAIDDIPNTLNLINADGSYDFSKISAFSAYDLAFLTTYAQKIRTQRGFLSIGANLKIINRKIGTFATAWGFGIEAGIAYKVDNWRFGFFIKDLTNTFNAWKYSFTEEEKEILLSTGNKIPIQSLEVTRPKVNGGVAYLIGNDIISFQPSLDLTWSLDGGRNDLISMENTSLNPSLGGEIAFFQKVFLRGGISNFQKYKFGNEELISFQPSFGIGMKVYNIYIEYAINQLRADFESNYSHIVSLVYHADFAYFNNKNNKKYRYK